MPLLGSRAPLWLAACVALTDHGQCACDCGARAWTSEAPAPSQGGTKGDEAPARAQATSCRCGMRWARRRFPGERERERPPKQLAHGAGARGVRAAAAAMPWRTELLAGLQVTFSPSPASIRGRLRRCAQLSGAVPAFGSVQRPLCKFRLFLAQLKTGGRLAPAFSTGVDAVRRWPSGRPGYHATSPNSAARVGNPRLTARAGPLSYSVLARLSSGRGRPASCQSR